MNGVFLAASLAWKDYTQERLLSACAVLSLAAVLAPLLILLGVQHGIISTMTERLLQDPRTLEVIPAGSGRYDAAWFAEARALPETAFIVPQTRSIAAVITLRKGESRDRKQAHTPLIASDEGDPLLLRRNLSAPAMEALPASPAAEHSPFNTPSKNTSPRAVPSSPDAIRESAPLTTDAGNAPSLPTIRVPSDAQENIFPPPPGIVLSAGTAHKLQAQNGDSVQGYVERVRAGKRESQTLSLRVQAILPAEAQEADAAYVPLPLLVALEDFRDGRAVPFLGWPGNAPDGGEQEAVLPGSTNAEHIPNPYSRVYASFRMYAKGLDDVAVLHKWFADRQIEVYVKSAEIENVKSLDRAFTVVFSLIAGAAVFGFAAGAASSALAGVKRKSRSLGLIRLMGFLRGSLVLFPVLQSLLNGLFGFLVALALYAVVAVSIDRAFAGAVTGDTAVCVLPVSYAFIVCAAVLLISACSAAVAARHAADIEPSEVIRDV